MVCQSHLNSYHKPFQACATKTSRHVSLYCIFMFLVISAIMSSPNCLLYAEKSVKMRRSLFCLCWDFVIQHWNNCIVNKSPIFLFHSEAEIQHRPHQCDRLRGLPTHHWLPGNRGSRAHDQLAGHQSSYSGQAAHDPPGQWLALHRWGKSVRCRQLSVHRWK